MANEQNLLKGDDRYKFTLEDHSAGGKASGISKRRKKICNQILNSVITNEEAIKMLEEKGIPKDEITELAFSMYDLFGTFKDKKGEKTSDRLKALEMFMGYAEEDSLQTNETPNVSITIVDNSNLEKAMYEEN